MDLEKVTAKVRPRKPWEAIDLGIALVQFHAMKLYKIWFLTTFPAFLVLLGTFHQAPFWAYVVFWWLKPLWERPLLHFLSRELFGERLTVKACVKSFFSLAKIHWFASLTWRRLSLTRSLDLPIIQLEGLDSEARSRRLRVIHSSGSGTAVWLTIFFVLLEVLLYFGMLVLAFLMIPEPLQDSVDFWYWIEAENDFSLASYIQNFMTYICVSVVAPFFTACGFALYINQRTLLEAWDIELSFKRLAKKLSEKSLDSAIKIASFGIISFCFLFNHQPSFAQESAYPQKEISQQSASDLSDISEAQITKLLEPNVSNDSLTTNTNENVSPHMKAKQTIKSIKESEIFNVKEVDYRLEPRFKFDPKSNQSESSSRSGWSGFGKFVMALFAFIVEFALWVLVTVILIFLLLRYRHLISGLSISTGSKRQKPKKLFGLEIDGTAIPGEPWKVARAMIEKNDHRGALSLMYQASLFWYIDTAGIVIKDGDTELECLAKTKKIGGKNVYRFFGSLTKSWRRLAYAHQLPEKEELLEFCNKWPSFFVSQNATSSDKQANASFQPLSTRHDA